MDVELITISGAKLGPYYMQDFHDTDQLKREWRLFKEHKSEKATGHFYIGRRPPLQSLDVSYADVVAIKIQEG